MHSVYVQLQSGSARDRRGEKEEGCVCVRERERKYKGEEKKTVVKKKIVSLPSIERESPTLIFVHLYF